MRIATILIFTCLLSFIGCKVDLPPTPTPVEIEDEWPTFIDTGANIVAYRVNGKIRVSKNISNKYPELYTNICVYIQNELNNYFSFESNRITDEKYNHILISKAINDTGLYKIGGSDITAIGVYLEGESPSKNTPYTANENDSGILYITKIDNIKRIICGKFQFTCKDYYGIEKKEITEGQFDLKY